MTKVAASMVQDPIGACSMFEATLRKLGLRAASAVEDQTNPGPSPRRVPGFCTKNFSIFPMTQLFAACHRDNHSFGDEVAWWERRAIDPIATSRVLWVSKQGPSRIRCGAALPRLPALTVRRASPQICATPNARPQGQRRIHSAAMP